MSVVSTVVYLLAIWTRESRHTCSPNSFLLTAAQISTQCKCSESTLDLSAERQEEGSVANRPSYSNYILLIHHTLSDCFANGIFKRGVLARLFVHDPSFHLGVVGLSSLGYLLMITDIYSLVLVPF